jgi:succinate dehydrogenase / fumarate reductase cytochrome b subunit
MSEVALKKQRPKYLNLAEIRLPLPGFVSILHRVSGALLFLFLPVMLWLFSSSLDSSASFDALKQVIANPLAKLILLGLLWAYLHHFCAGIRYLFLDLDMGLEKPKARQSAGAVLVVSLLLTLIIGVTLW